MTKRPPRENPSNDPGEDGREAIDLPAHENASLCAGCVKCCTYITVEVDTPRSAWEYDQWIWALHHRNIQLYVEQPERWFLHVEAVCGQLQPDGRCGVYERRPVLCREYDPRACERRLPLADMRAWFDDAAQLEEWLRKERPAHWRRLLAYRGEQARASAGTPSSRKRAPRVTVVPAGPAKPRLPAPLPGFVPVELLATRRAPAPAPSLAARRKAATKRARA